MTIYKLMNKVRALKFYLTLAAEAYRENKHYYSVYEMQADAALGTLMDVNYITPNEYEELRAQMWHIMRVYKRAK